MTAALIDEETPLLISEQEIRKKPTPIPWGQFSLILILQLAEPLTSQGWIFFLILQHAEPLTLTSQVIYPFAPQLIRDLGITNGDESRVGFYVGMMQSLFFATQVRGLNQQYRHRTYMLRRR